MIERWSLNGELYERLQPVQPARIGWNATLEGEEWPEEAVDKLKQNTRRFANLAT